MVNEVMTGQRIRSLRLAKGMSQEELGMAIGVKKAAISKYENGSIVNLKQSVIQPLADALETSPAYLMGYALPDQTTEHRQREIREGEVNGMDIFYSYKKMLEGAGPKLKELVLDRAAQDKEIRLYQLKELVNAAYPEENI